MRKAFDKTVVDPQFIEAAKQANIYINPMGGEELRAMVERIAGPSESVLTMLRQATQLKGMEKTGGRRDRFTTAVLGHAPRAARPRPA